MIIVLGKPDCPWCDRVKTLLSSNKLKFEYKEIKSLKHLNKKARSLVGTEVDLSTVPQVFVPTGENSYVRVGGYEDTQKYLNTFGEESTNKSRTVFNANNLGHTTGEYPLFLGDQLGFIDTINSPYPILDELYQTQMGQIWNEFEVDLTQDRQDMINAPREVVDLMVKTILWQHLADSIASRSITGILMDHVSNSDLEAWYNCVALFETIHARTYSHIIKQTFVDPNEALMEGYKDLEVIKRSDVLKDAFDDLGNTPFNAPKELLEEKIMVAVVALYMLESLNFMSSFAITFGIAETGIFQGISQDVGLICRDEVLHGRGGGEILKIIAKDKPLLFDRLKPKFQEIFDAVIETENSWTDYLFSEGRQVIGVNPKTIKKYVSYMAQPVAKTLDLECEKIETNPLPYMESYIDSSSTQAAAQEIQLTSYVINPIKSSTQEEIDSVLSKYK